MFTISRYGQLLLSKFGGLFTEAPPNNLPPGASPQCWDVDFTIAGVGTRPGLTDPVSTFTPPITNYPIEYLKSAALLGPLNVTIAEDAGVSLYVEYTQTPGVFTQFYTPILNNARAVSETVNNREYIGLSDLSQGTDQPRQYDGTNTDRISQVGPGVGPSVTVTSPTFDITAITEIYPAVNINSSSVGSAQNLHAAQPPSTNLYFYSAVAATTFTTDLSIGDIIYVAGTAGLSGGFDPNGTYRVTSIGFFTDVDGTRQVIGVTATVAGSGFARNTAGGTFRRTPALVQFDTPLPLQNAVVGQTVAIEGTNVAAWNTTWTIEQTPTEGQLSISATALTSDVATYDYTLQSGVAPGWQANFKYPMSAQIVDPNVGDGTVWQITTPGTSGGGGIPAFAVSPQVDGTATWTKQAAAVQMLVTVFNTNNGDGVFNLQSQQILKANNTSFTVAISSPDVASAAEIGSAFSGSGSTIIIDSGLTTLGTGNPGTNPIFGNATGGSALVSNSQVAAGQRYAVTMLLSRNGYISPASPPTKFFTTPETSSLSFGNLPIGTPWTIARIVAITLANAGPGGPYFWVPNDVIVAGSAATLGVSQTFNSTVLHGNSALSLNDVAISDAVLAVSVNISTEGNNLQQQREIGEFVKPIQFASRVFYLGERVKNDQFVNLTFDGGKIQGIAANQPAGWTVDADLQTPVQIVSVESDPPFDQFLLMLNTTGATINPDATALASIVSIHQSAYQTDFLNAPIIQASTDYSVRVFVSNTTGAGQGSLIIELYSPGLNKSWKATFPEVAMNAGQQEFIADFNNPLWDAVPNDLMLRVYPFNFVDSDELAIYRIEVFPTKQPVYTTRIAVSYGLNPEAVDSITGAIDTSRYSSAPQTNHFKFLNKYYITTGSQTFSPIEGDSEPSGWRIDEISNTVGSFGPFAQDVGEEYTITADVDGAFVFDGGNHMKISQEIQKVWNQIYKPSNKTVWILNDTIQQRILFGVPMVTPNQWLPNAPVNLTPSLPNVILVCSYLTLMTGAEIANGHAVFPSAFTGNLLFHDAKRKWTIWQIPAAIGALINRASGDKEIWFGDFPTSRYPLSCPTEEIALAPGATGDFEILHGLDHAPCAVLIQMTSPGKIWLQAATSWDATKIYFTASDADVTGYAQVYG